MEKHLKFIFDFKHNWRASSSPKNLLNQKGEMIGIMFIYIFIFSLFFSVSIWLHQFFLNKSNVQFNHFKHEWNHLNGLRS